MYNNTEVANPLFTPPSSPRISTEQRMNQRALELNNISSMPQNNLAQINIKIDHLLLFVHEEEEIINRHYGIPQSKSSNLTAINLFRQIPETTNYHTALAEIKKLEQLSKQLTPTPVIGGNFHN